MFSRLGVILFYSPFAPLMKRYAERHMERVQIGGREFIKLQPRLYFEVEERKEK